MKQFADDTKIYREIKFSNDCASLQEDFDSLSARSADSELSLNEVQSPQATRLLAASLSLQRQSVIWVSLYPVT